MRRLFPRLNSVASIQIYTFWTTLVMTIVCGAILIF
ncbi:MAG: hypothetical protein RL007_2537 [Bacteroidota bacterium]|jgi:hypothetical protein